MRLIFNHDEDAITQHNHSQKILQASHVVKGGSPLPTTQVSSSPSKLSRKKAPVTSSKDLTAEEEGTQFRPNLQAAAPVKREDL